MRNGRPYKESVGERKVDEVHKKCPEQYVGGGVSG